MHEEQVPGQYCVGAVSNGGQSLPSSTCGLGKPAKVVASGMDCPVTGGLTFGLGLQV